MALDGRRGRRTRLIELLVLLVTDCRLPFRCSNTQKQLLETYEMVDRKINTGLVENQSSVTYEKEAHLYVSFCCNQKFILI